MGRIELGFLPKGILTDNAFPFLGGAHEEVDLHREVLHRFPFQKAFELGAGPGSASEHEVPALKQ
jgi:hypothetical protein